MCPKEISLWRGYERIHSQMCGGGGCCWLASPEIRCPRSVATKKEIKSFVSSVHIRSGSSCRGSYMYILAGCFSGARSPETFKREASFWIVTGPGMCERRRRRSLVINFPSSSYWKLSTLIVNCVNWMRQEDEDGIERERERERERAQGLIKQRDR